MGIWTPQEDDPLTCDWCSGLILSKRVILSEDATQTDAVIAHRQALPDYVTNDIGETYCNEECELAAAKAERKGEWISL